jgi:hypothetical protein
VVSSLGLDGVRSVGEQEVLEVLGERFSSSGGERVRAPIATLSSTPSGTT